MVQYVRLGGGCNGHGRVDAVRAGASALRQTVEEIIICDLFNGTVKRWDEQVKISNVRGIDWSNYVADEICLLRDEISLGLSP
jgi:hypothetical protein